MSSLNGGGEKNVDVRVEMTSREGRWTGGGDEGNGKEMEEWGF